MPISSEFLDHINEQLTGIGPVSIRRMFGGAGLFYDGLMFALVVDDTLYLKTDSETENLFEEHGLSRFSYQAKGQRRELSYRRAPDDVFDDAERMLDWARIAISAARRADKAKRPSKPKSAAKSKPRRKAARSKHAPGSK